MKIVFLARFLPAEGSTTHMYTLASELIKIGHDVTIISAGPSKKKSDIDLFNESKSKGINHYIVKFPLKKYNTFIGKIFMLFKYILVYPKVSRFIRKNQTDIVHCHYPVTTYIPAIMRFFNKKYKFITTHHIIGIPKHPLNRMANKVIAISDELEKELEYTYGYKGEDIIKIYNGVSTDFYISNYDKKIYKKEINIDPDIFTIGFVGSFSYRKGIDILLSSLEDIDEKYQVVLLGEGSYLKEIISNYNIKGLLHIRDFNSPINYYKAFDCLILPSRQEGFPLVPIEAMLSQTVVIRSGIEGASQQIINNETGFLFENENIKELTNYIELLMNNKQLKNELAINGQKFAHERFTSKIMMEKTLKAYEDVEIKYTIRGKNNE
ncbi:glycosyltransferase family 4 protein [Haploplasma modicum]|uniref:glycosyltransferase family 4 protein n=1 Tax=Haploplasma modicum TaxID=2150 RepID=UPI00047ED335|nr:glycosyltransferase family 4 protein [Haploplasma modicum]